MGPLGIFSIACKQIRRDCRISSMRTRYRSYVSPFVRAVYLPGPDGVVPGAGAVLSRRSSSSTSSTHFGSSFFRAATNSAAFGDFVAAIPAPLGVGRVELADGREVSGFLCEPHAIVGATEITGYGGWRSYLARVPGS